MRSFPRLQKIFQPAVIKAAGESGMLLGQELAASAFEVEETTRDQFVKGIEDACLVAGIDSFGEYPGTFYLVFSLRDAIVMSGSLLGIPPARIAEKSKLAIMEGDDLDAFAEILNQMTGSFKSSVQPIYPGFQLKLLPLRRYVPQDDDVRQDDEFAPEGDYVVLKTGLALNGKELDRLQLLVPLAMAEQFDPPQPPVEAEQAKGLEQGEENEAEPAAILLFLQDDDAERSKKMDAFREAGYKVFGGPVNANLHDFTESTIDMVIVTVTAVDDRSLDTALRLKRLSQTPLPAIISAPQWTRTAVLKALKHGARDVLIEPVTPEELLSKVCQYMKAA